MSSTAGEPGTEAAKRAAAAAAASRVESGMRLGLGTGTTVTYLLDELARRGLAITGVPTSEATARQAESLGFTLLDPDDVDGLDLAIDGADELDARLRLTKGGGGALLREKVVATMADHMLVIATTDKLVERLGDSFALPVEVVPFAVPPVSRSLEEGGFEVDVRGAGGFLTDNGNAVLDCRFPGGIGDPEVTDVWITLLPGVVCSGLFVDLADAALLADPTGEVRELSTAERGSPSPDGGQ